MMRPTKEMILETKELVNRTQRDIQKIIKENDMKLKSIREKDKKPSEKNYRSLFWILLIIALILSYPVYRFFIP